jgi:2-hydroxychromene-2-carboxylate isomerase
VSFAADLERAPLTVALELRDPFAYLALGPAIAFGRELDLAVDWLPVAGQPLRAPSTPGPEDDRGVRHRRHRAHMLAREIAVYAEAQGLDIREPYRNAPADPARLAWLWVRAHAAERLEAFLEELFRCYWRTELDPSDPEAMADLVAAFGADPDRFLAWRADEGAAVLRGLDAELTEAGCVSSPTYLAAGELFRGRQHLPMIRWLLEGKRGPVPI